MTLVGGSPAIRSDSAAPDSLDDLMTIDHTYTLPSLPRTSPRTWERRYVAAAVASDLLLAAMAGAIAYVVRFGNQTEPSQTYLALSLLLPVLWVAAMGLAGAYERRHLGIGPEEFNRVMLGAFGAIAAVGVYSWATAAQIARGYVVVALPVAAVLTLVGRYALRKHIHEERARGRFQHRTIVLGHRSGVSTLVKHLKRSTHHGYDVVGACLTAGATEPGPVADTPVLGTFDDIVSVVESTGADTVAVVSTSDLDGDDLRRLSWALAPTGATVVVAPGVIDIVGPRMAMRPVEGLPLLQVEQPAFGGVKRVVKQTYDPIAAAVALVLLSPLFLAVAIAIKADSKGPVFFRQTRVGRLGAEFKIVKFRTMSVDAESRKKDISHLNEGAGPLFKMRNDPRVTRVGSVLRRTSLDELPQLFNVLAGQMSLVGPRPHLPSRGSHVRQRLPAQAPGVPRHDWALAGKRPFRPAFRRGGARGLALRRELVARTGRLHHVEDDLGDDPRFRRLLVPRP